MSRIARPGHLLRAWAMVVAAALFALLAFAPSSATAATGPTDLLPRLAPSQQDLADNDLVQDPNTGQIWLRYTGTIENLGDGPADIVGKRDPVDPATIDLNNNTMPAYQRIHRSDGTTYDVLIGQLIYHPEHHHFHFVGSASYQLFDSTGALVMESPKVSFCLADVKVVDSTLPGFFNGAGFASCSHDPYASLVEMGISVGWADVYTKDLVGQSMDVTALMTKPQQTYTLKMTTNPFQTIHEANQAPPASASVQVVIGTGVPVGVGQPRPGV